MWRRMAHRIVRREKMEGGTMELPRTRTSRVPWGDIFLAGDFKGQGGGRRVTIATLVEAMCRIAVVGEDDDFMAAGLQAHGCVDDEAFCAANAKIGVEEDNCAGDGVGA